MRDVRSVAEVGALIICMAQMTTKTIMDLSREPDIMENVTIIHSSRKEIYAKES